MWCVCFFPNPFTALLGPVHRWGMVLMDGFLFSFHTSASISFPSQTPTATTFSLSLILITAEQFSLSLIFQLISSPLPPWYLHLPLNSLNGFRRLRWPAELYCRHIIYIKKSHAVKWIRFQMCSLLLFNRNIGLLLFARLLKSLMYQDFKFAWISLSCRSHHSLSKEALRFEHWFGQSKPVIHVVSQPLGCLLAWDHNPVQWWHFTRSSCNLWTDSSI